MENLKPVLDLIISKIKIENLYRDDGTLISEDQDNEALLDIFREVEKSFDLDIEIEDSEDALCELFGLDGYHAIRDAEYLINI